MKGIFFASILLCTSICSAAENVDYFSDSIMQKKGNTIRLLGGSSWESTSFSLAMVADDIVIVFRNLSKDNNDKTPIIYHNGMQIPARYVSGAYVKSSGFLANVIDEKGDGAILELDDGTILAIPDYDQFDTGWWWPPYPVLVTSNGLYMWNLKEGKRVWVEEIR